MKDKTNITGIILSGGKSSRMGSDKGFVLYKDKPFVQYSVDALKPLINEIIIVSDHQQYNTLGYKVIKDSIPEAGPLSGLYSGLKESKTTLNLVLSCDVPLINSETLKALLSSYTEGIDAVVCKTDEKIMPLVGLYNKDCFRACEKLLHTGERRMMRLLESLDDVKYLELNEEQSKSVKNINSLKDLNEIKMEVKVKYFGMLAEITGCNSELLVIPNKEIAGLKTTLLRKYPDFLNKDFRIAQNQELVSETQPLTGEEIAILPPFAGG